MSTILRKQGRAKRIHKRNRANINSDLTASTHAKVLYSGQLLCKRGIFFKTMSLFELLKFQALIICSFYIH